MVMGLPKVEHQHSVPDDVLLQLRRMVSLIVAAATNAETDEVIAEAKEFEKYIESGR
jgi:hypothetical protein